jgi:hypothetical protein
VTVFVAPASLRIEPKSPAEIGGGQPIKYEMKVRNEGPYPASGVRIDIVVSGTTAWTRSGAPEPDDPWACAVAAADGALSCSRKNSLDAGATDEIKLSVTTPTPTSDNHFVKIDATATAKNPGPPDARNQNVKIEDVKPTEDKKTAVVRLVSADLKPTKPATDLKPGEERDYELGVWNDGPTTARDVQLKAKLTGTTFKAPLATMNGWQCKAETSPVQCTRDAIPPKREASFKIPIVVAPDGGEIKLEVSVVATTFDPNLADNSVTFPFVVKPEVTLGATAKVDPVTVKKGQRFKYAVEIENKGPSTAKGVTATISIDKPAVGFDTTSSEWPLESCKAATPQQATCSIASLQKGKQSLTLPLAVDAQATTGAVAIEVSVVGKRTDEQPASAPPSAGKTRVTVE